ncbi:MAG: hypothetical protein Q8O99_07610 [bacterium]|nr:hypothetical protein [bacterium]
MLDACAPKAKITVIDVLTVITIIRPVLSCQNKGRFGARQSNGFKRKS